MLNCKKVDRGSATLLYEQSKEAMLAARRRLMDKYPIMFVLGKSAKCRLILRCRCAENKLVNFTTPSTRVTIKFLLTNILRSVTKIGETKRRRVVLSHMAKTTE